jgi:hypothetical protein
MYTSRTHACHVLEGRSVHVARLEEVHPGLQKHAPVHVDSSPYVLRALGVVPTLACMA